MLKGKNLLPEEQILSFKRRPISKRYLLQRSKQEFMQVNMCLTLFSDNRQGALDRTGAFITINIVFGSVLTFLDIFPDDYVPQKIRSRSGSRDSIQALVSRRRRSSSIDFLRADSEELDACVKDKIRKKQRIKLSEIRVNHIFPLYEFQVASDL